MSESVKADQQFDERFVACQDELYGYIGALLPRRDDADEVFQETSLKLLQNRKKYDSSRPFRPWAFTIALNEVRLFIRRRRRGGVMFSDAMLTVVAEEQFRSDTMIRNALGQLADCLKKLAEEKRRLLEQCYAGTHTIKTIAARQGVEADALYKQLERIRRVLFDCMKGELGKEERRDD
jgi:RNA polymerase sigma-70 factor, ECF subfamily